MIENNPSPNSALASPLRYEPSFERLEENEAETDAALTETMLGISETTFKDGGRGLRSVHAKSHGLLTGSLRVLDDLSPILAQGIAAHPGTYPVVIRLSTTPGDILGDSVSTPRAMALKIIGVEGPRLPESEGGATQDFVLANRPAFTSATAKKFLGNLKLLAATTDRAQGAKKAASAVLRGLETVFETFGHKSPTVTSLGGQRETHILGDTFYSQAPLLWGPYMAKVSVRRFRPSSGFSPARLFPSMGSPMVFARQLSISITATKRNGISVCSSVPTSKRCRSRMPPCPGLKIEAPIWPLPGSVCRARWHGARPNPPR
jgi:hypothetical protein